MSKLRATVLTVCLLAASVAHGQAPGGSGGGHGGRRGDPPGGSGPAAAASNSAPLAEKPADQVEIIGVIKAIDAQSGRITIQYEETDALTLPAGTLPFEVSKTALLNGVSVGEKVRFRLESHQIAALKPF